MCVGAGRMCTVPKAFPREFREDVIRVYKSSDSSVAQVAKDFGISPSCLKRWLTVDERRNSSTRTSTGPVSESDALREANRRIKLLEQENEVLRRAAAYLSQAHLPGK
jgi:transposase-like protein